MAKAENTAKSYKGIKSAYDALDLDVRAFIGKMERFVDGADHYDVALAYLFVKIEEGHHRLLRGVLIKKLNCDKIIVDRFLSDEHFTRKHYTTLLQRAGGKSIPSDCQAHHDSAAKVRDKIIHGKAVGSAEQRAAVFHAIRYISALNEFSQAEFGFRPYASMTGYLKSKAPIPKDATIWMLRGLGFVGSKKVEETLGELG